MMDRLRNRDLRTSINKCYSIYFDDENQCRGSGRKAKSKSPRKREQPCKDNCENELKLRKVDNDSCPREECQGDGDGGNSEIVTNSVELKTALVKDNDNETGNKLLEDNNNQKDGGNVGENLRKRRLSSCSDASGGVLNGSKRIKADSLKEQMFQVGVFDCLLLPITPNFFNGSDGSPTQTKLATEYL